MKKSNWPHEAVAIIDRVLQLGKGKYPDAHWRALSVAEHVAKAKGHLNDYLYALDTDEDSLAHALTRLAMAVSNREYEA